MIKRSGEVSEGGDRWDKKKKNKAFFQTNIEPVTSAIALLYVEEMLGDGVPREDSAFEQNKTA